MKTEVKSLLKELLSNGIYQSKFGIIQDHLEVVSGNDKWNGKFGLLNSLSVRQLKSILEEVN